MANGATVSIGLPVYNGDTCLREAISSLLGQSYRNIELIVADNASSDATAAIVEEFSASDSRVQYFRHDQNIGAVANFDFVLKKASGEYFMWAAFDDFWDEHWIKKMVLGFEQKDIVISFGKVKAVDQYADVIRDCEVFSFSDRRLLRLIKYFWMEEYSGKACIIYGLFRTSFLLQRKPFSKFNASNYSDMLFVFNCLNYGAVYIDPSVTFYKRMPPDSNSRQSLSLKIMNSVFMLDRINYYVGHVEEAGNVFEKTVLIALLPLKYVKAVLSNLIRMVRR